ncbi:hypothetical protein ACIQM4_15860 [Streptomyces sp. NPDC091272]|uniref:hypothetical protein n=1 Tax=Streptomyces sp. NPDC091272 TaxID=3365981 RepID=UPI003826D40A
MDPAEVAERARLVAQAWDASRAAAAWRAGYHPMGDVVQPPRGGWRGRADEQAYRERNFVLRAALPAAPPGYGRAVWAAGQRQLTRPVQGAGAAYEALSGGRAGKGSRLTVTGVRLGDMTLATSGGPAVVPAWLFTLDGYDTPLRRAALVASEPPSSPVGEARGVPGGPLEHLSRVAADGRSVTVGAFRGDCGGGLAVDVLETGGTVVLTVSLGERGSGGLCTKRAGLRETTVRLERALGERLLLDSYTGRSVPNRDAAMKVLPVSGS